MLGGSPGGAVVRPAVPERPPACVSPCKATRRSTPPCKPCTTCSSTSRPAAPPPLSRPRLPPATCWRRRSGKMPTQAGRIRICVRGRPDEQKRDVAGIGDRYAIAPHRNYPCRVRQAWWEALHYPQQFQKSFQSPMRGHELGAPPFHGVGSAPKAPYMYDLKEAAMLSIRLPEELEARLGRLAKQTSRTKSFYVR